MSYYSDEFIGLAFGKTELEKLLSSLELGDRVSAAELLTLSDGASDDAMEELLRHLDDMDVTVDISELPKLGSTGESALRLREEEQLVRKGSLLTGLDKNDPLRLYLEELAAIPVCGDENVLAMELAQANASEHFDEGLCGRLLNLSLSRILEIAKEYVGRGVLLLDLMQEGSLGLWAGLDKYAAGSFEDFRDWEIRSAMTKAVLRQARSTGLSQKLRQAVEDYRMVDERLLSELGRNPTVEELAEQLHLTVEETEAVRKTLDNARLQGKAHSQPEPEEEDPEAEQAVEDTAYYQTRERVDDLMSGLTEKESKLLNLRYGLDGKPPRTAQETGRILNMTAAEVVELEAAALAKMRRTEEK